MVDPLAAAVESFASTFSELSESDLARPWTWGDYDEGVRFAFFRTYESLRQLATQLAYTRAAMGMPQTTTQLILAQYHAAYRDLQAVVLGLSDAQAEKKPAPGEWSLRTILAHIIDVDVSFWFINKEALRQWREGEERPTRPAEVDWQALQDSEHFYQIAEEGAFSSLIAYYAGHHIRVLQTFSDMRDAELEVPVWFWESKMMPIRFRLHRFDSHLRQHTIQAEKTLVALGREPAEARRLLRLVFNALAEVEATQFFMPELGLDGCKQLAEEIAARQAELQAAF